MIKSLFLRTYSLMMSDKKSKKIQKTLKIIYLDEKFYFIKRFKKMEELTKKPLGDLSFDEWENLWARAKTECAK